MNLVEEQKKTIETPRLNYGIFSKLLFLSMDLIYGKKRTLIKFKIIELLARIPYQAWENQTYQSITNKYNKTNEMEKYNSFLQETRHQQDNEQWHLLILEELLQKQGIKQNYFFHYFIPRIMAMKYKIISWLVYKISPLFSFKLNVYFEDHAEHEYMLFVQENPQFDSMPFESAFRSNYGDYATYGDVFRRIGLDEREHKNDSLKNINNIK